MRSLEQVNIRTNVRTYVRTYSHTYVRDRPYIPSTTLLCEGIIRALELCFSQNSHCDLDLGPRTLKLELVQDIVILNICVK